MKFMALLTLGFILFMVQDATSQSTKLGLFDLEKDLLVANYDSKPDVDDLHSTASFATMLRDERLENLNYIAVAGAYGTQDGQFIEAGDLFDLAFEDQWVDAHSDKEEALDQLLEKALETLNSGGDIWIAEAGQSDVSADLLMRIREDVPFEETKSRVHLVQHSFWNESATTPDKLNYVREQLDYIKIPDGNGTGNGTPGFRTEDGSWWDEVLSNKKVAFIWQEARRLGMEYNVVAGYDNTAVGAGGFDFSDTSELCWIFGFEKLVDTDAFFSEFLE